MEAQIRHSHPLQYVRCVNMMSEYVCTSCCEVYYQYDECQ